MQISVVGSGYVGTTIAACFAYLGHDVVNVDIDESIVEMINDALGTDIDPVYVGCSFDGYVHDAMADYTTFHEATGWEPEIGFEEGVKVVCEPYLDE